MPRNAKQILLYEPSFEETADLAHQLFEERGSLAGRELDDWFEAETVLFLEAYVSQLQEKSGKAETPSVFVELETKVAEVRLTK